MKKLIAAILTLALLAASVTAFAEGEPMGDPLPQEQTQGGRSQAPGSGRQNKKETASGQGDGTDVVSSATKAPENQTEGGQAPESDQPGGAQSGKGPQRGQNPLGGQANARERKPQGGGEAQPEQQPGREGKHREGNAPGKSAFADFVARGVISQETADQIRDYLKSRQPAETAEEPAPESGETLSRQRKRKEDIQLSPELLQELLDAEIITQAEYDAMLDAQTELTI